MKAFLPRKVLAAIGRFAVGCGCLLLPVSADAQIIPDNTLGTEQSQVVPGDNLNQRIEGGAVRGHNLFHSFDEFNVNDGQSVYFENPGAILTIFSRVTGDNPSAIDGTLGVEGSADLFLLNSNGIVFGPNAELDIAGSLLVSTADKFTFPGGSTFSATAPEAPPLLTVNVVPGLEYWTTGAQPLVNEANLTVGQNFVLSGGAITSSGQLTAGGEITVEGVAGDVQVQEVTARTALLSANGNLLLDGSQLETTGDLTLLAGGNIQIQDTVDNPFIAAAGVDLIIQGDSISTQNLDGFDGNYHPESQLSAGRDLIFRSSNLQLGNRSGSDNALYSVGSYFRTEQLDGTILDLWIPYSDAQVVRVNGDVEFGQNYSGPSLYLLVEGQVTTEENISDITINAADFGKVNAALSNGDMITLQSEGQGTLDIRSGADPDLISGTLLNSTNLPAVNSSILGLDVSGVPTGTDIILGYYNDSSEFVGSTIRNEAGNVALLSQSQLGPLRMDKGRPFSTEVRVEQSPGNIIVDSIDTSPLPRLDISPLPLGPVDDTSPNNSFNFSSSLSLEDGGAIMLSAGNDIFVGSLNSSSSFSSSSGSVNVGNGGAIILSAGSNITTNEAISTVSSFSSFSGSGNGGDGGAITFLAGENITINETLSSSSTANSFLGSVNVGRDGGAITLLAGGNITANRSLSSSAEAFSANDVEEIGDSGAITLSANGNIITREISSSSSLLYGEAGDGGAITISAGGNITTSVLSSASSSNSGDIAFPFSVSNDAGNGGAITISAGGNIITTSLSSFSESQDGGVALTSTDAENGGAIRLLAGGNITANGFLASFSRAISGERAGNGGGISLSAGDSIVLNGDLLSFTISDEVGKGGDIYLDARSGNIQGGYYQSFGGEASSEFQNSQLLTVAIGRSEETASNGGNVNFRLQDTLSGFEVTTLSSASQSGAVQITGGHNLQINNTRLTTSAQLEIPAFPGAFLGGLAPPDAIVQLDQENIGQSGNTLITSSGDLTFNNFELLSNALGSNPAGNVSISSPGQITFNNSQLITDTDSEDPAATGGTFIIQDASQVILNNSIFSSEASGVGQAGSVLITTPFLKVENDSRIATSTRNIGQAGNILLNTDTLNVTSGTKILAATEGGGNGGTITVNAPTAVNLGLDIQDFAPILSVETSDAGRAGNIVVNTPTFTLSETARITATAADTATNLDGGGSISLNANQMNLAGVVGIFAETEGQAPGGILTLQPYQNNPNLDINLAPGARISASTSGSGTGGNLQVTAPESIHISGQGELAVATTGSGRAGNIDMAAQAIELNDGVRVSAISAGEGPGGNINVDAGRLTLRNNSQLITQTRNSDGGNITLDLEDYLLLRHNSLISSTAGTAEAGGNGGNIDINVPNGFIVAVPRENSDITANAFLGDGGNVTVAARNILGTEFRDELTPESDITASSRFGNDGTVTLNTLNVDPGRGLTGLPANLADQSSLIAQRCLADSGQGQSAFVVTGRGGVPPTPIEVTQGETSGLLDLESYETEPVNATSTLTTPESQPAAQPATQLVEAQTWTINENGDLEFVAQVPGGDAGLSHGESCAGS